MLQVRVSFVLESAREDAHAIVEHAIHRLPVLVTFERRLGSWIVNAFVFEVAVVLEDQIFEIFFVSM